MERDVIHAEQYIHAAQYTVYDIEAGIRNQPKRRSVKAGFGTAGSRIPLSENPLALSKQESHRPQGVPNSSGS